MRSKFRLDEVTTITMGQAPPGDSYNAEQQGWPLVAGAGDFKDGKAKVSKFTTRPSKISNTGDIILGIRASIGEKVTSDGEYCLGRGVAGIRPSNKVNPSFLWHWLTHNTRILAAKGKGATFKQVNREDIGELEIELPSLEEQALLSKAIDSVESARKARRRSIELLDELTQSIFLDMFGDPGSTAIPWVKKSFSDVIVGLRYGTSNKSTSSGFPALRIPNVVSGSLDLEEIKTVPASDAELERLRLEDGDLLFVRSNGNPEYVGRCALFIKDSVKITEYDPDNFIYASYLIRARPDQSQVNPVYVREFMLSRHGRRALSKKSKTSAGQYNLNGKNLGSIPIPIPPLELQKEFEDKVSQISLQRAKYLAHLAHLDELFASVQQRAFDGTLWDDPPIAS